MEIFFFFCLLEKRLPNHSGESDCLLLLAIGEGERGGCSRHLVVGPGWLISSSKLMGKQPPFAGGSH